MKQIYLFIIVLFSVLLIITIFSGMKDDGGSGVNIGSNSSNNDKGAEKGIELTSQKIFNPNAFSKAEKGLFLADLKTGIQIVTKEGITPFEIKDSIEFRLPAAMVLHNRLLYIADYRNNRIVVLDEKGNYQNEWTNPEMSDPEGIAADDDGNIYVASYGNGKILKLNTEGELINSWTNASNDGSLQLKHPHGIFVYNNSVFVTELLGDISVIQYSLDGEFINKFGNEDRHWKLKYPTSLWVHKDKVLVADAVAHQIKIFDTDGNYIKSLGELGLDYGQFFYPYGVGVDEDETIYVGDTHNHRVQFFTMEGNYIGSINSEIIDFDKKHIESLGANELKELSYTSEEVDSDAYGVAAYKDSIFTSQLFDGSINNISQKENIEKTVQNLIYPWSIKYGNGELWVIDEPGSILSYSKEGQLNLMLSLTSLQFDPTESVETWIYRPQDVAVYESSIAIANAVPGNIVLVNNYGGVEKEISLQKTSTDRVIPTGIDFINKENIVVVDMVGKIKVINLNSESSIELKSPIGFYQPYRVNVNKINDLIAVTEPYANRIQFYDKKYNWVGFISNKSNPLIDKPVGITSDDKGNFIISNQGSKKLIKVTLNKKEITKSVKEYTYNDSKVNINSRQVTFNNSPFIKIYDAPTNKALDYWSYYKDDKGIVKYDFSFSWLNFKVPVDPGYGNHIWPTGIAHYSMLNYYKWKETHENQYKDEFLTHVNWLLENGVKKTNGVVVWPNEIRLRLSKVPEEYISASAQAGAAGVLMKAIEVNPENKKVYLDYAHGALKAFEYSTEENGVRSSLNGEPFFIEYPGEDIERVDILPFMWTLVFLKEAGQSGEPYYIAGKETAEIELAKNKVLIGGFPYWGEQFNQTGIDLQTSKTVVKILDALNINIK